MSRHDPLVRLRHMRDFARKALSMVSGKAGDALARDEVLRLAVTHLVELVGEAAAKVPPETRGLYPQIPWLKLVGMRNRLIHGYDSVDHDILWDTITTDLPQLLDELGRILTPDG